MRGNGLLLVWLLIASLLGATTLHAQEVSGVASLECSGSIHAEAAPSHEGDPAEQGKATIHHHGCHGASSFLPTGVAADMAFHARPHSYTVPRVQPLLTREASPALRPPIA